MFSSLFARVCAALGVWTIAAVAGQAAFAEDAQPSAAANRKNAAPSIPSAPADNPSTSLLDSFERDRRLVVSQVRAEVHAALRDAREQLASRPAESAIRLKLILERVDRVPELSANLRAGLRGQLEAALRESIRRAATHDLVESQSAASRAAAFDRLQSAAALERDEQRVQQLMDRFESLMDEGRHRAAESLAVGPLAEAAHDTNAATAARHVARQAGNHALNMALRSARQQAVVSALAGAETSHMPLPDDEPIVYSRAPVWQALSERRAHYARTDLRSIGPAEAKIRRELATPTMVEFAETPLDEAVDYLQDVHGIAIQLDRKALEEAGVFDDSPVTLDVENVSLRTVLRLMLRPMDLTYVVEDEVLMITTVEVASQKIVTAVYPLGDLVLPAQSTSASGTFGGPSTLGPGSGGPGFNMPGMNGPGGNQAGNMGPGLPF